MKNEARKHHYVPRSVLRNFTIDGARKRLFVFDKNKKRSFAASVENTAAERDFYRVQFGNQDLNYEEGFQELDDRLANVVAKLVKGKSLVKLEKDELRDIPILVACQLLRTKLQRTTPVEFSRQLEKWIKDFGFPTPNSINDANARRIAFIQLFQLKEIADLISEKDIMLLILGEQRLWTSDNPVVVHNNFPYGETGLKSPGVEIYYPLSPNLCLAFYCTSIREILSESIDPNHPRQSTSSRLLINIHNAFVGQRTLEIPGDYSSFLNSLQIYQSSRFLYSSKNEFGRARTILSKVPGVANVKSRISLRKTPVPPAPKLPGTCLVACKGYRHFALPIELVDEKGFLYRLHDN